MLISILVKASKEVLIPSQTHTHTYMSCYLPADNMDHFGEDEFPLGSPSPRRQLQGPRPTPLKVHKDSHKITKPPIPPPQNHHGHHNQHHHHQQQQPLIIYTISPKVIHTNPCDFMSLVQRLTGPLTNNTATTNTSSGALSPAARFAAIEKTKPQHQHHQYNHEDSSSTSIAVADRRNTINSVEEEQAVGGDQYHHQQSGSTTSSFPGILSPHPSTLPPISPNFFSPLPDPNSFNFLHDMSPLFNSNNNYNYNKNFIEGTFVPSPTTNFLSSSPTVLTSPTLSFDLFNHFLDF